MGGGGGIIHHITDAVGDATGSVKNFIKDPINTAYRNISDLASRTWERGWVTIPGTDWQVNLLGGFALGFSFTLPIDYRHKSKNNTNNGPGPNPYRVQMRAYVNDIKLEKNVFSTVPPENSVDQIKQYFRNHPTYDTYEFCSDVQNSTLRLVFNDTEFSDNDGVINVSLCYLGKTDDCNCNLLEDPTDVAVGFTRVDANMQYPVAAHGMVYVGDKNRGLSTGGRCEVNDITQVEERLLNKYNTYYSTKFDDTESTNDLQKDRVLDLVYEYNGTTWVRKQDLIESVYYHTGVGTADNAVFFGGIHDSIAAFTFAYDNKLSSLPATSFEEWDCSDKENITINQNSYYGTSYPNALNSSTCWQTPSWQISGNFSPTCSTVSSNECVVFNDPRYAPNATTNISYLADPNFPAITILNVGDNGSSRFTECRAASINVQYPTNYTLNVTAQNITSNMFHVTTKTNSVSGVGNGSFLGNMWINSIQLSYKDQFFIYPDDIDFSYPITNEFKYLQITEINTNQDTVNVIGTLVHEFMYKDASATQQYYSTSAVWVLYFNGFADIIDSIKNGETIQAIQSFISLDSTSFAISGGSFFGSGSAVFGIENNNGVGVGVINENYDWNSSLESCGQDLVSALNISASIGSHSELRWGAPLWSRAFTQSANLLAKLSFNSKKETNNSRVGEILHEITDLTVNSNSIMALANKRVIISGKSQLQEHDYYCYNDVNSKGIFTINNVNFALTDVGSLYTQENSFVISNSGVRFHDFPLNIASSNVSGYVTINSLACCSGTFTFPSSAYVYASISAQPNITNLYWNLYDYGIWSINDIQYVASSGAGYADMIWPLECAYGCLNDIIENTTTGAIVITDPISAVITFPSAQITVNNIQTTVENGNVNAVVTYDVNNTNIWQTQNATFQGLVSFVSPTYPIISVFNSQYISGNPINIAVITTSAANFSESDFSCCSGMANYPTDFVYNSTTYTVSGNVTHAFVDYYLYDSGCGCVSGSALAKVTVELISLPHSQLVATLKGCPVGTLTIELSSAQDLCESTTHNSMTATFNVDPSGYAYSEYASTFVQEYRSDTKNKVVESWKSSNDFNIIPANNGVILESEWKRYNDGVGLGGDAPNYDTIMNPETRSTYPTIHWKEIGSWNIGQMAFGSVQQCVIVGGHKVDRNAGLTLKGSGLHASDSSKRIFIWDRTTIAPEDSYLKNYYTRRFNTYSPNGTIPISSNENNSDLNVIMFEGESDIVVERVGTATFDGNSASVQVIFDKVMPQEVDVNYSISLTCSDNVKVWWEAKSTAGFTLKCELSSWKGTVDYLATTIIKATETDITNAGNSSGFIFDK